MAKQGEEILTSRNTTNAIFEEETSLYAFNMDRDFGSPDVLAVRIGCQVSYQCLPSK